MARQARTGDRVVAGYKRKKINLRRIASCHKTLTFLYLIVGSWQRKMSGMRSVYFSISRTTIITAFFLNTDSVYISFISGYHRQAFSWDNTSVAAMWRHRHPEMRKRKLKLFKYKKKWSRL
jgi:hypothetical protein